MLLPPDIRLRIFECMEPRNQIVVVNRAEPDLDDTNKEGYRIMEMIRYRIQKNVPPPITLSIFFELRVDVKRRYIAAKLVFPDISKHRIRGLTMVLNSKLPGRDPYASDAAIHPIYIDPLTDIILISDVSK